MQTSRQNTLFSSNPNQSQRSAWRNASLGIVYSGRGDSGFGLIILEDAKAVLISQSENKPDASLVKIGCSVLAVD